jgi:hypothetical protein
LDVFKFLFSERTLVFTIQIFPLPQNPWLQEVFYTWYQVIISSAAIKNHIDNNLISNHEHTGNNLAANYTFKFKHDHKNTSFFLFTTNHPQREKITEKFKH